MEAVQTMAEAMGSELSTPALILFADALSPQDEADISRALLRCACELRGKDGFPPRLTIPDVLDRIGVVTEGAIVDAEARVAWDLVIHYVDRFVFQNAEGQYEERDATGPIETRKGLDGEEYRAVRIHTRPELEQRTRDTVRRVGGWRALKNIAQSDYPHIQRRFYDEFRAWRATDVAINRALLDGNEAFQALLDAKQMPSERQLTGSREQALRLKESN